LSYRDRLRQFEYTAPDGSLHTLQFTELSRSGGKKAPVTEFPQQDQGAVQDLGQTTPRYPISGFIAGADYDQSADEFWRALTQAGPGTLNHPRWGVIEVLPVSIEQTEQFVNGAGRAVFDVEFVQTEPAQLEYPRTAELTAQSVIGGLELTEASILSDLEGVEVTDPRQKAGLKEQVLGGLDAVTGAFDKVTGISDDVQSSIRGTVSEITRNIDSLVAAPQDLVESLLGLYRTPADVITDIRSKIGGYSAILETFAGSARNTTERYGELFGLINGAQAQAIGVSAAQASVSGTAETRATNTGAIDDLSGITGQLFGLLEDIGSDGYESSRATRQTMTASLRALIDRSLDLPAERVYLTPGDLTPIELVWRLYGEGADLEAMLNRIIGYNNLQGSQLLIVPRSTEVRWYV